MLTEAMASWTASLWKPRLCEADSPTPVFYIDGHRKAVYADQPFSTRVVGRQGKVLGCRALAVLHDQAGHPRLVTTHRGDQHLTSGLSAIITRYEQAEALQRRLDNVKRWTEGARKRMHNASTLYRKRCQLTKERATEFYRVLNTHQMELERQGVDHWQVRQTIKEEKARADAEIEEYQQRQWKSYHSSNHEFAKCEKYCREQRELLRAMEELAKQERELYELENRKDQVMTVCKVALANLGMWVNDHYFPAEYAHTGWHRLQAFFQLPGRIFWGRDQVEVELKQFNIFSSRFLHSYRTSRRLCYTRVSP